MVQERTFKILKTMFGLSEIAWLDFLFVDVIVCLCLDIMMSICVCCMSGEKDSINKLRKKKSLSGVESNEKVSLDEEVVNN